MNVVLRETMKGIGIALVAVFLGLVTGWLLCGCPPPRAEGTATAGPVVRISDGLYDDGSLITVHDAVHGVTCWIWRTSTASGELGGFSCLADWTLLKPEAELR